MHTKKYYSERERTLVNSSYFLKKDPEFNGRKEKGAKA